MAQSASTTKPWRRSIKDRVETQTMFKETNVIREPNQRQLVVIAHCPFIATLLIHTKEKIVLPIASCNGLLLTQILRQAGERDQDARAC
jgi:hypothetical protein